MKTIDKVSQYRAIMESATRLYLDNLNDSRCSTPMGEAVNTAIELDCEVRAALELEEEVSNVKP